MHRALFVVLLVAGCTPSFEQVQVNLNEQREIYHLDPVYASSCEELLTAFDGYEDLVTRTVEDTDPNWAVIAASECRTFFAHVDAFEAVCSDVHPGPAQDTIQRCSTAGVLP